MFQNAAMREKVSSSAMPCKIVTRMVVTERTDFRCAGYPPRYQEKVIKAGFSAIGRSKWLAMTVAIGRMATKSVIFQS